LKEGQHGFCYVRQRLEDQIVLTTYGKTSGIALDPIEKKPLYHFLPGSTVLSFGTIGCNLNCRFCQNWNISKSREEHQLPLDAFPEDIAQLSRERGAKSVAFTYNEPIIFHEFAVDTAKAARSLGIKAVAVTNGYINGVAREHFFRYMDAANVDLKAFSEKFYRNVAGGKLGDVLETLVYIKRQTKAWLEVTTLLIPGENDSPKELNAMADWIITNLGPDVPIHFSAFHPDWKMNDTPPTPPQTLFDARDIARKSGIRFVYTGNIRDVEESSTFCSKCGRVLIERDGFQTKSSRLSAPGRCLHCNEPCPGIWN